MDTQIEVLTCDVRRVDVRLQFSGDAETGIGKAIMGIVGFLYSTNALEFIIGKYGSDQ